MAARKPLVIGASGQGEQLQSGDNLDVGSSKITSVTDPTALQDAATKNYVDTQVAAVATGGRVLQVVQAAFAGNTTTTSTANPPTVALLSQAITVAANSKLLCMCRLAVSNSVTASVCRFIITVDGTEIARGLIVPVVSGSNAYNFTAGISAALGAGARTVEVRWAESASGTLTCNQSGSSGQCQLDILEIGA